MRRNFQLFFPYAVATAGVALALALRLILAPWLGDYAPFLTYFGAVALAAWLGGFGPALLAIVLGALVTGILESHISSTTQPYHIGLVLYCLISLGITLLFDSLRTARQRAEASAREARDKEEALRKHNERLKLLWEAAGVLLTTDKPDAMLQGLFSKIGHHLGLDTYFNYMVDEAGTALRLASCAGIPQDAANAVTHLEFGQAVCGTVALQRKPLVATHIQQSDDPKTELVRSLGLRAYACNPLLAKEQLLGTLSFGSRSRDAFTADELEFLETISHYVTVAYERLRLIERLREADRQKDEFLAMLAHELRNPLAPIRNALTALRLQNTEPPQAVWEMAERQMNHLTRLVDDLLDVSRITRGKIRLQKEPVELKTLLFQAVESSRPLLDDRQHRLDMQLPDEPLLVEADPTRLVQVVLNLLNNAAKYTPQGGMIRLNVDKHADQEVSIRVQDNGIGLPPQMLAKIFDLFTQVDRTLERTEGGLGIGLTLVKRLTEMHGGSVTAHSEGLGQGSEFRVRLPLLAQKPLAFPTPEPENAIRYKLLQRRILVVDDNKDCADSLTMLLKMIGHEIRTAYNGHEALEMAAVYQPELIFLDIGMPGLNGHEVARRVRSEPRHNGVVLIAVTGFGSDEDRRQSQEAGFDHHIVKPVDFRIVEQILTAL